MSDETQNEQVATKAPPKTYTQEEYAQLLDLLRTEGGVTKDQCAEIIKRPVTAVGSMRKRLVKALGANKVPAFKIVRSGGPRKKSLTDESLIAFLQDEEAKGNIEPAKEVEVDEDEV